MVGTAAPNRLTDHEVLFGIFHFLQVPERLDKFAERHLAVLVQVKVPNQSENFLRVSADFDGDGGEVVIVNEAGTVAIKQLKDDPKRFQVIVTWHILGRGLQSSWSVVGAQH